MACKKMGFIKNNKIIHKVTILTKPVRYKATNNFMQNINFKPILTRVYKINQKNKI